MIKFHFKIFPVVISILSIFLILIPIHSYTQIQEIKKDTIEKTYMQADIIDVYQSLTKKKDKPRNNNDTNNTKNSFTLLPAAGYSLQTGLALVLAANYSFKPKNYPNQNSSLINAAINYTQRNQIFLISQSYIWMKDNKYFFPGEFRIMKYPLYSFGFGSKSLPSASFLIDNNYIRVYEDALIRIWKTVYAGPGYKLDYRWKIEQKIPDSVTTDFNKYGYTQNSISSGITLNILHDNRDNIINSTKGSLIKLTFRVNTKWLGSNSNWQSLLLEGRKFFSFDNHRKVLAFWSYNWFTLGGNPPYLDIPSLGWDSFNNTGRGYIQSRFIGKQMLYNEAEYRFAITRNGLLGAVIFGNAHSFTEWPSIKFEKINFGYGGGIRIKLNKFSESNIAIDYGFGSKGSRGLFVNLGEVF